MPCILPRDSRASNPTLSLGLTDSLVIIVLLSHFHAQAGRAKQVLGRTTCFGTRAAKRGPLLCRRYSGAVFYHHMVLSSKVADCARAFRETARLRDRLADRPRGFARGRAASKPWKLRSRTIGVSCSSPLSRKCLSSRTQVTPRTITTVNPAQEVDIAALAEYKLKATPLAGFVEGVSRYGRPASTSRHVAAGSRSRNPTSEETETVARRVKNYQAIFDTH